MIHPNPYFRALCEAPDNEHALPAAVLELMRGLAAEVGITPPAPPSPTAPPPDLAR